MRAASDASRRRRCRWPSGGLSRCAVSRPRQSTGHSICLARLRDREDPLVLVVEASTRRLERPGLVEPALARSGNVQLPDLVGVARLDEVLGRHSPSSPARAGRPRSCSISRRVAVERRRCTAVVVEVVRVVAIRLTLNSRTMSEYWPPQALRAPAVAGTSTWRQPSSRAIGRMLSPAAPPPATSSASRGSTPSLIVISLIARDHVLVGDCRGSRVPRLSAVPPSCCGELADHHRAPRPTSSFMRAAEEVVRVEVAEHQRGVGDRRLGAAAAVAGGTGIGAGALRARRAAGRPDRPRRSSRRRRRYCATSTDDKPGEMAGEGARRARSRA